MSDKRHLSRIGTANGKWWARCSDPDCLQAFISDDDTQADLHAVIAWADRHEMDNHEIDYRNLLAKYVALVAEIQGVNFVYNHRRPDWITDREWAALTIIANSPFDPQQGEKK